MNFLTNFRSRNDVDRAAPSAEWLRMSVEGHVDWAGAPGLDGTVMARFTNGQMHYDWSTFVADEIQYGPLPQNQPGYSVLEEYARTKSAGDVRTYRPDTGVSAGEELAQDTEPVRVGLDAAAGYLGMKRGTFEQARKRTDGKKIPGEFRRGDKPAWYEKDLDAWMASRPRAGKRAI